jgi:alcohol dehydrogenase class IV
VNFTYEALPSRVIFGVGAVEQVKAELDRLKVSRVLVIHGRNDRMAPEAISRQLYEQLKAAGDRVQYLQPLDREHWNMIDLMSRSGDPTMLAVERFILGK